MYNFTDLIARSYLKYVNKGTKKVNIAQVFFQEYYSVRPEAEAKYIFSHQQFFTELINEIDTLTKRAVHNHHLNSPDFEINDAEDFEEFQKKKLLDHQSLIDDAGVTYVVKRVDYEESTNAKQLTEALKYGLNLIDPVKIITPSKTIQADDLVLRKSKLEYLKTEAIRARDANIIGDLDAIAPLSSITSNTLIVNPLNYPQSNKEDIVQRYLLEALEIIKPLGGVYVMDRLLNDTDMKRLNHYVMDLIKTGELPISLLPFPKTSIPNQFIRKTMHMVYILIKKKNRGEFIKLTHLFQQFDGTECTTTDSKFSTYEGRYKETKSDITF